MERFFKYVDGLPKAGVLFIALFMNVLLGIFDNFTGYEISFSIFYLLPVGFVSWFSKRSTALIFSFLSAVIWLWADIDSGHTYSNFIIPYWNSITRLGFFLIVAFSFSKIKHLLEQEKEHARNDFLTGIANSRAFNENAKIEIERSVRFNRPFTTAYIDVDNFKKVNDTFGHSHGDNLLKSIASTIKQNTRSIDIVSRLGGDEFAILFPETDEENAKKATDKIHSELMSLVKKNNWPVTFSIGVVTSYKAVDLEELIKEADHLMYAVKESGKNRVEYKTH